jgi:hypothetical protein
MQKAVSRLMVFIALAGSLLVAVAAKAQTIELPMSLYRKERLRPIAQQPNWVNRADCLADDVLTFYPVKLADYAGFTLQVWAADRGIDCTLSTNRAGDDSSACWLLYDAPAASATTRVDIPAVELVARTSGIPAKDAHGNPIACSASTPSQPVPLELHFLLVDSHATIAAAEVWNQTGYDVVPPLAPTKVTATSGDTRIALDWTPSSALDVRSYRFYCDPAPGTVYPDGGLIAATTPPPSDPEVPNDATVGSADLSSAGDDDGGVTSDAGVERGTGGAANSSEDGVDAGKTCSASTVLVPNADPVSPDPLDRYVCGSVASGQNGGTVAHLANYVDYVVAVAAVDQVGNVGVLSNQVCEVPAQITDFFELYRQAGGSAGGGICSLARPPVPNASSVSSVVESVALVVAARRRRRKRRSPPTKFPRLPRVSLIH